MAIEKKIQKFDIEYNLLSTEDFTNVEEKYERNYFLTCNPNDSDREIWMRDVYDVVTTSKPKQPTPYKEYEFDLVGITLPKYFISEVLNFESKEKYLNQFKLYFILGIIEENVDYAGQRENRKYPITGKLIEFFSKKKKLIYEALIQQYLFRFLDYCDDKKNCHYGIADLDTFICDIKNIYNNPLDGTNYSFPISDTDIEDFISSIDEIEDICDNNETDKEYLEQVKTKTLEFVYRMIKPITKMNIDYIFDMALDYPDQFMIFYEQSDMPIWTYNEFFIDELYEKITKQPRMSLFQNMHPMDYPDIVLYFSNSSSKLNFKWQEENIKYEPKRGNIEYIEYFRDKKKINVKSSKYIGDKYEKFCQLWLVEQGYSEVQIIGGRGDKGVDIIAINVKGEKVGIQCKYKESGIVRSQEIRLLDVSRKYYEGMHELMIFSNCPLSRDAIGDMAKLNIVGVTLTYSEILDIQK